ncbi:M23 family metallopeptidase [Enterovirga aerilata]|uniref:Peptidoglycan DD-metalloendopeptidase family protein n=1 Tax=Enterovirga aerilata TaxID=2730920 RepID=A0A849IB49_9HYPH|nr:M23 family metallopeptidase [Enterovirga sp. DB1703]NNM74628.1 peptidoglycan DD-metalloendopeptidase family protein [Enterovirga sp. DB1703]
MGLALKLILAVLVAWAAAATWFAWSGRARIALLQEEQLEMRLAHDEKEKALVRRLVGVASHGILEQEGLSGRLADIISRQVELENRQWTLMQMSDRVAGGLAAPSGAPGSTVSPAASGRSEDGVPAASRPRGIGQEPSARAAEPPKLRLGAPRPGEPAPAAPGPRSSLDLPGVASQAPRASRLLDGVQSLPLREQFGALEASMSRLEGAQIRYLGALASGAQNGVALIRASLATLGLSVEPAAVPERQPARSLRLSTRAAALNPFEAKLASLETELVRLDRWRGLVDAVPVRRPVEGEAGLTSNFGLRKDPFTGAAAMHAGIDFRGPLGTPIRAAAAGRVVSAEVSGGYGNLVELEHGNGLVTRYAHLSALNVSAGQSIGPGTVVGLLGSTGRSTGPHLHYETRLNGSAVDPMRFLLAGAQLFNHPAPVEMTSGPDDDTAFD